MRETAGCPRQNVKTSAEAREAAVCMRVQVLHEIAGETIAQLAAAPRARRERPVAQAEPAEAEDEDDLAARLDAIRS